MYQANRMKQGGKLNSIIEKIQSKKNEEIEEEQEK